MEQKNILFIGEINKPTANANGICIEALAESMAKNHKVSIASYRFADNPSKETLNGVRYLRVKPTLFYRMREYAQNGTKTRFSSILYKFSLIFNKIKKVLLLPLYPISSIGFILRYYRFLKKEFKETPFDTVVSIYFPIDSLLVGRLLKRKYPDIKHVLYLVDTISNGANVPLLSREWTVKRGLSWEHYFMKHADSALVFKAHESHYRSDLFKQYHDKIEISDVPLFIPQHSINTVNNDRITLLYSGSLIPGLRSPESVLALLSQERFKNCFVELYTQGGFDDILQTAVESTQGRIQSHPFIAHDAIMQKITEVTVLISIGNSHSTMIPSKTFEYISTGKPIIHFYNNDADTSLPYFETYQNCIMIDTREALPQNTERLAHFLSGDLSVINSNILGEAFEMNTPNYTNQLILK